MDDAVVPFYYLEGIQYLTVDDDVHYEPHYESLRKQVLSGRCVAFLGSGLSTGLYPSWTDLVYRLCVECNAPNSEAAKSADADLLIQLADDAHSADPDMYYHVLDEEFGRWPTDTRLAYDLLMRLPFQSYVTTNFDPLLEYESRKPEHRDRSGGVHAYPSLPVDDLSK